MACQAGATNLSFCSMGHGHSRYSFEVFHWGWTLRQCVELFAWDGTSNRTKSCAAPSQQSESLSHVSSKDLKRQDLVGVTCTLLLKIGKDASPITADNKIATDFMSGWIDNAIGNGNRADNSQVRGLQEN